MSLLISKPKSENSAAEKRGRAKCVGQDATVVLLVSK
jgi:hypothetical protein